MRISSLNTSTTAYTYSAAAQVSTGRLDKISNLYQLDLKQIYKKDQSAVTSEPELSKALVYTRKAIDTNTVLSNSAVVLENADGSLFTLDTSDPKSKINLVTKGKNIELYVYNPADATSAQPSSVLKYKFDSNGVLDATNPITELKPWEVSDAEISTKRDLDGNGTDAQGNVITKQLGGNLDIRTKSTAVATAAARKAASGGIFKLEVLDQTLFVVGNSIEKSKQVNANGKTLLNADGSAAWAPEVAYETYRAVAGSGADAGKWTVYATKSNQTTQFKFDTDLKLTDTTVLTADEVNSAEVANKRDLNVDKFYGAQVTKAIDKTGGLFTAQFQGATVYLAQTGIKSDATGANPVSFKGKLLNSMGSDWSGPAAGFDLTAVAQSSVLDSAAPAGAITVFATDGADKVLKYTFTKSGAGNTTRYTLDEDSSNGLATNAIEMAAAEKAAQRDLNGDTDFGVKSITAKDAAGGLYKGSMLGSDFYIVGKGLKTASTGSLANDLSHALIAADGSAWNVTDGYTVATVVQTANKGQNGSQTDKYSVYAYADDGTTVDKNKVLRYDFESDTDGNNVKLTASDVPVTAQSLSDQEKALTRDLNSDGALGVTLTTSALDVKGGLYKASLFGQDYVVEKPAGQSVVDLSVAFYEDDGITAWTPKDATGANIALNAGTFRLVKADAQGSADATIYITTGSGTSSKFLKVDFQQTAQGYKQEGNRTVLSAEEMAAAEKANNAVSADLNGDGSYGVVLNNALDQRGGLFKGSLGDRTNVFFKLDSTTTVGSKVAADATDFDNALTQDSGYWSMDTTGKTVKAFADGTDYIVLSSDNADKTKITKYTFDTTANNKLTGEADIHLNDLIALETNQSRDMNADGIIGVRVSTLVPDKVGGLYTVSAGGDDYLAVNTDPANITDLSQALRNADGTRWSTPSGTTRTVIDTQGSDYKVYAYNGSTKATTEYTFGSDYKIRDAQTRTLTDVQLADAEKAADSNNGRDINGDGVIGARVNLTLKATAGDFIYQAKLGNTTYTVVLPSALNGTTTDLSDKALLKADGTRWTAGSMTFVDADVSVANSKVTQTVLYMKDGSDGHRITFGSDGKLLSDETISDSMISALSATVKTSYMAGSYVDTTSGLFLADVLGKNFYVVGNTGANPNAPTDLSQVLMQGTGSTATAWAPEIGYTVGGMVKNANDGYDIYTYQTSGGVTDVKKSSWNSDLHFLGSVAVDAANLVEVEVAQGRDLNKDGAFGFAINSDQSAVATYKGVTAVNVGGGSLNFLVTGTNLKPGTALAPIGLKDALLNEQGSSWLPNTPYSITAVDDSDANTRVVYASNADASSFMKYSFDKSTGKLLAGNAGTTQLTPLQMAAEEINNASPLDINGDGSIGLGSISQLRVTTDDYSAGKATGLLQAQIGGSDFLVYDTSWASGDKIDLSNALLKADGSAWTEPANFRVQGTFVNAKDELEVYGHDSSTNQNLMFKFAQGVDSYGVANGAYTLMPAQVGGAALGSNTLADADLAKVEYADALDLNADGAIGYKASATPAKVETGATNALGQASLGGSQIYFFTSNYANALQDASGNEVGSGALYMDSGNGLVYWSPTTSEKDSNSNPVTYDVKSVVKNGADVEVWALRSDSTGDPATNGFVKYSFAQDGNNQWVLDASTFVTDATSPLSYDQIVANESGVDSVLGSTANSDYTGKDINGDGVIGMKIDALVASGLGSNIYSTTLKVDDGNGAYADNTYYMVGSNLASGTSSNPLGMDTKYVLLDSQGGNPWVPDGAVTNWTVLDPVTADAQSATHSLDDNGTTKYFFVSASDAYFVS